MAVCKNCGAEVADGVKFCNKCGSPMEASSEVKGGFDTEAIGEKVSDVTNKGKEFFNENVKNFQNQDKNTQNKIIGIAAAVAVVLIALCIFASGAPKRAAKSYMKAFSKNKVEKMEKMSPKFYKDMMEEEDQEFTDVSRLGYYADEYDFDSVKYEVKSVKKVDKDDVKDLKEAIEDETDVKARFSKAYQVKFKLKVKFDDDDMEKYDDTYYLLVVKEGFGWKVMDLGGMKVDDFIDILD